MTDTAGSPQHAPEDAGAVGEPVGSGTSDDDRNVQQKQRSYSPGSEREMEARDRDDDAHRVDIDEDAVRVTPGTGGPDDQGDVEVDPDELHMPHDTAPHEA